MSHYLFLSMVFFFSSFSFADSCTVDCAKSKCVNWSILIKCQKGCGIEACDGLTELPVNNPGDANNKGIFNKVLMMNKFYQEHPKLEFYFDFQAYNKKNNDGDQISKAIVPPDDVNHIKEALLKMKENCTSVVNRLETQLESSSSGASVKKSQQLGALKSLGKGLDVFDSSKDLLELRVLLTAFDEQEKQIDYNNKGLDVMKSIDKVNLVFKNCLAQGETAIFNASRKN